MDTMLAASTAPIDDAALDRAAERAARALGVTAGEVVRFESSSTVSLAGAWAGPGTPPPSAEMRAIRLPLHRGGVHDQVRGSGRPARVADYARLADSTSQTLAELGTRSAAAAPIVVDGALWGSLGVSSEQPGMLRSGACARLERLAEEIGRSLSRAPARKTRARAAAGTLAAMLAGSHSGRVLA